MRDLPKHLTLAPFHVREALEIGIGRSRLRAADLDAPFRGIRAARTADASTLDAANALLGDGHFLSHVSAAQVWGIRIPRRVTGSSVHVSALIPDHAPRMPGVVGHRLLESKVELAVVDGIRVTTACDTWRHLSTILGVDELIVAGDSLLRRQHPLATEAELRRALARHSGERGVRRLRAAYSWVRAGTDSAAETRLRLVLLRAGLPAPEINGEIMLADGTATHGDLVYRTSHVVVEYDGIQHRTDPRQFERDILRHEALAASGWRLIRVVASHLRDDPARVVARVRAALARE